MSERLASFDKDPSLRGIPNRKLINLYEKWAHGNFGMLLTGNVIVHPTHLEGGGNMVVCQENDTPELRSWFKKLAEAMKSNGSLAVAQISDAGINTPSSIDQSPWAPSDRCKETHQKPNSDAHVLTEEEIETLVIPRYVYAAKFLYECGFDGIELHSAPISLLSHFLSAEMNNRNDSYGGSIVRRMKIFEELESNIRAALPEDIKFLIGVKIHKNLFLKDNKLMKKECKMAARMFDKLGYDFIEATGSSGLVGYRGNKDNNLIDQDYNDYIDEFKKLPHNYTLYLTGKFREAKKMVDALEDGGVQGIGLGRPATAEPDIADKILSGKVKTAKPNALDEETAVVQVMAAASQIWDIAQTPYNPDDSLSSGIVDFSNEALAGNFKNELMKYMRKSAEMELRLEPAVGIFHFRP
ncbi:hypothetical protein WR25_22976 [Diploscapter pachys]|uniref:NADH:flavin oxidoreductase/NADH oxidase N-terminal domain-containing protein n=1 Tax=Diploscapter pachys TaxID=2018661 RepID=A0A2A2JLW9_9BILA|nr:hypothetical protein WR25_22976 [Diploscapter pachys]